MDQSDARHESTLTTGPLARASRKGDSGRGWPADDAVDRVSSSNGKLSGLARWPLVPGRTTVDAASAAGL